MEARGADSKEGTDGLGRRGRKRLCPSRPVQKQRSTAGLEFGRD